MRRRSLRALPFRWRCSRDLFRSPYIRQEKAFAKRPAISVCGWPFPTPIWPHPRTGRCLPQSRDIPSPATGAAATSAASPPRGFSGYRQPAGRLQRPV